MFYRRRKDSRSILLQTYKNYFRYGKVHVEGKLVTQLFRFGVFFNKHERNLKNSINFIRAQYIQIDNR